MNIKEVGNAVVDAIKPLAKSTRRTGADADLGGFGALFDLKVAQSNVIVQRGHKQPLLLIDDLASELDDQSKRQIFNFLAQLQSQVFITAIEPDQILPHLTNKAALFHVEHGQIKRTDNDGRRT